jgi:hypothetical protein
MNKTKPSKVKMDTTKSSLTSSILFLVCSLVTVIIRYCFLSTRISHIFLYLPCSWDQPIPMQVSQRIAALLSTLAASPLLSPNQMEKPASRNKVTLIISSLVFIILYWRERVGIEPTPNMYPYPALDLKSRKSTRTYSLPTETSLSLIIFFKDKPCCHR